MRRDMLQLIFDLDDKPIAHPQKAGQHYTLLDVALSALMAVHEDERSLTGKDKADRFSLAMKINRNPQETDLTVEQLALLKTLIGKGFGPLVVGRAYELLEQEMRAVEGSA